MTDATLYRVPKEPGRWRAILLATLVHVALLVFLWIGVRWQNETPMTIEAEVWSPQPREAAPQPTPEPQPPKPPKQPEPEPPVKEIPKPTVTEPPVQKPDIALEQEKKRKALEQKKREQEEAERLAKQKQKEEEARQEKLKREKEEIAKRKKQEAEEQAKKEKAEKEKKALAEAKRRQEEEAYEKQMAKMREENLKRMTAGLGGTGDAHQAQGGRADANYVGRIAAKIKSNTIFNVPEDLSGNPAVEYTVELLPDGSLRGTPRKLKSSGVPGFDDAVLRAIEKSQPFPRDKSGSVPSSLTVSQKPKDQ
ncbi:cell envelope integrity protein TolA [Noviherbaspirillum massiliense]|uniref:cell envelope integrity protein TolA n=1 Tax=Noviherbaspirillum massiliense TaxID=1465823 RepID=UPI00036EE849|nr:cell envelope integrity protein TolA [Noviherbaspirillum massiliense]